MNNWEFNDFYSGQFPVRLYNKNGELLGKMDCTMLKKGYRLSGHCYPSLEMGEYYKMEISNSATDAGCIIIDYVTIDEDAVANLTRHYVVKVMPSNSCSFVGMPLRALTNVEKLVSGLLKEEK